MSLVEHAKSELRLAGWDYDDINAITGVMQRFFTHFDSGGVVFAVIPVLERLLRGLPLLPLTGENDEWHDPMKDGKLLQNKRCFSVFKYADGRFLDVDAPDLTITFPYMPKAKNLDPVIVFEKAAA